VALDDPKLRYRVELETDRQLLWFAQIEYFFDGNPNPGYCYTARAETWDGAFQLAKEKIIQLEKGQ
jgi:hypothetical protein